MYADLVERAADASSLVRDRLLVHRFLAERMRRSSESDDDFWARLWPEIEVMFGS